MIARLVVLVAGVIAAALGTVTWAKRRTGRRPSPTSEIPAVVSGADDGPGEPSASEAGDNLQDIKGIGSVSEQRLTAIGVTTFAQIAAWTDDDAARVATEIKVSAERIKREDWVGQARTFAGA